MAEPTTNEERILYLITIICQQKKHYISKEEIDEVILWLKMNIPSLKILNSVYETSGRYNQLHFHAVATTSTKIYYKPFTQWGDTEYNNNTFKIHWSSIYDYTGACAYIQKDLHYQDQDQILIKNYYKHHYFNQDTQRFSVIAKTRTLAV